MGTHHNNDRSTHFGAAEFHAHPNGGGHQSAGSRFGPTPVRSGAGESSGARGLGPCAGLLPVALGMLLASCGSGGGTESFGPPGSGGIAGRPGSYGDPLAHTARFHVYSASPTERTETVRVTVPFGEGAVHQLDAIAVNGHQTAWELMQRWPDGSVRLAQALFTTTLQPASRTTFTLGSGLSTLQGAFVRNDWVDRMSGAASFGARVRDNTGVDYEATVSGPGETLQESFLHRVTRHRVYHEAASGGIGRDFLSSTFYVTEFRDSPVQIVDWVLGNDYQGLDDPKGSPDPNLYPLGPVDVNGAWFVHSGVAECKAYRPGRHGIGSPVSLGGGQSGCRVMTNDWIDDGQTRRYRFLLRYEVPGAAVEDLDRWRQTHEAMASTPLRGLADIDTWQVSRSLGLHGGPLAGPADAAQQAAAEYNSWQGRNHFGTWGTFGDVKRTATTGTPRNAPVSPELAHAIQGSYEPLLEVLEQKAWAQAVRPYHVYGIAVGAEQDICLWYPLANRNISAEHLGRVDLRNNDPYGSWRNRTPWNGSGEDGHGWNGYDHEHWSTDLLYDYWSVSNDAWAKEELRQLGQSLKGLMRLRKYYTSEVQSARAEGWCMTGLVQCYLATGDEDLKTYAIRRIREVLEPGREKAHASKAMVFQGNYPNTQFPGNHEFLMPWQHGAVLYGFLAAYRFFEEPLALTFAEDVVTTVEYSWVTNYSDPNHGFVADGLRYYTPISHEGGLIPPYHWDSTAGIGVRWGDSPLGGAHTFLTGGLLLMPDYTSDAQLAGRALFYGKKLLPSLSENARWYKWNLAVPDYQYD